MQNNTKNFVWVLNCDLLQEIALAEAEVKELLLLILPILVEILTIFMTRSQSRSLTCQIMQKSVT